MLKKIMKIESEPSETTYEFEKDTSFDDLESRIKNIEAIPSMGPRLDRIGAPRPHKDRRAVSLVEVGFRNFHKTAELP